MVDAKDQNNAMCIVYARSMLFVDSVNIYSENY